MAQTNQLKELTKLVSPVNGVIILTEDSDDIALSASRDMAAKLAALNAVPLTLYYRSEETWADTPHPEGPLKIDDSRLDDVPELAMQIRQAESLGASAQAWISTLPVLTAISKAIRETKADTIISSAAMSRHLLERVLPGDSIATTIHNLLEKKDNFNGKIVEISEDGEPKMISEY